jgi:uncharacterized repeat protein (TIGR01451 family)
MLRCALLLEGRRRDDGRLVPAGVPARPRVTRKILPRLAALLIGIATAVSPFASRQVDAAVVLSVTPLTWNVVGLDSNDPATGPNRFPIGARVCATGSTDATDVTVNFVWDSANVFVALRPGSLSTINLGSIAAGSCDDAYFEVEVDRTASAFDTTRRYHITASDGGSGATASTPTPRELYVEHLISQNRNGITSIKLNGVAIPAGGSMSLVVGNTYDIELAGYTATQGYNQLESFINFPNTIFQTLAVSTTYSANTSAYVTSPDDQLYADACLWENNPNSPNYRSCVGGDAKSGGTVVTTYTVKIISGAGTSETLSSLLYDFSGSSFHYNADFGVGARTAEIISPESVTITKAFSPKAITPGGTSTLTLTLSNPTSESFTGVHFSDTFPAGVAVAAPPDVTYTGCGAGAFSPTAGAGDTSFAFEDGTLSPNSSCRITVDVTAPAGTYDNTTDHLFINDSVDTGNTGADTLIAADAGACTPGLTLATWTMPASGQGSGGPPPPYTTKSGDVATATASTSLAMTNSIVTGEGNPANAWASQGFAKTGTPTGDSTPYLQFALDTSQFTGVTVSLDYKRDTNWGGGSSDVPTMYVYSSTTGLPASFTLIGTTSSLTSTWQSTGTLAAAATGSATTYFRINARGTNSVSSSQLFLDNVAFVGCGIPAPSPTISKAFVPDPIVLDATSTLTFVIANTEAGSEALTGVAFTDVLPPGLAIADSSTSHCGGAVTTTASTRTIELTGGQLAAGGTCTFDVSVTGAAAGDYDNVTGFVSSTEGGMSINYATDSLTVIAPPVLAKSFTPASILTGDTTTMSFTITNPNPLTALSLVSFLDFLPPGMTVAPSITTPCGGLLTVLAPGFVSFSGGSLAANETCTFSLGVLGTSAGSLVNTTSTVTSAEAGVGNAASATLVVSDPAAVIELNKQISTDGVNWFKFVGVPVGGDLYYRFSVYNGGDVPFTSIGVFEPFPILCTWTGTAYPPLAPGETAYCVIGPISADEGTATNTATATGEHVGGSATSAPSTATYATTGLTIDKTATETHFTSAGDVLHYTFLVTNSGFAPLLGPVTVNDDKATDESCPAVTTAGDLDEFLDPGESVTCTASYTVAADDVTAGSVTNTASANADDTTSGTDGATVWWAGLSIDKTATETAFTAAGDVLHFTFLVTNTGFAALAGPVTVADDRATDETCPAVSTVGDLDNYLDPGESVTCTASYTVQAADVTAGSVTNIASASADGATSSTDSATVSRAALTIDKVADPTSVSSTVPINWTITVTNTGTADLTGVSLTDDFGATLVSGDTSDPGVLNVGEAWVYTASHIVTQNDLDAGDDIVNTATVDTDQTEPESDSATTTILQPAAIAVAKSSTTSSVTAAGQVVPYTFTVTSTGSGDLTGITAADPTCDSAPAYVSGDANTDDILQTSETWLYGCDRTVTQDEIDAGGDLSNTVTVDSAETGPETDTLDIPINPTPGLSVEKTSTTTSITSVGQVVPYTFLVSNTGAVRLNGITVSDPTCDATPTYVSGDIDPADGWLQTTETWVWACDRTVTQEEVDAGGDLSNTVTADSTETEPTTDTLDIPIDATPGMAVAKASITTSVTAADQVVPYTFTVTNTGDVTLTEITVTDPTCDGSPAYVSGDDDESGTLQPSETWIFICDRTVTQADLDAGGDLSNTVAADSAETTPTIDTLDIPISQLPALTITKAITSGASYSAVGDVITYEYVVVNAGNVTIDGPITVVDDRTTVSCPATSSLAPGASITCTASYTVTADDLVAGSITNVASASGFFGQLAVESLTATVSASAGAAAPSPPSSDTLAQLGEVAGGMAGLVAAALLVLVGIATIAFLILPTRRRSRPS